MKDIVTIHDKFKIAKRVVRKLDNQLVELKSLLKKFSLHVRYHS